MTRAADPFLMRATSALPRIDFAEVAGRADLRRLIEADTRLVRGHRYACPFHGDGHSATLTINPDGKHWTCWHCGAKGDAIDWVKRRDNLSIVDAARKLDPTLASDAPPRRR